MSKPRTIIEKLWDSHVISEQPGAPALLYIDLHLVHEVTSPQAFAGLRQRGLKVRRPDLTIATVDHSIPTTPARCRSWTRSQRRRWRNSKPIAKISASLATAFKVRNRASFTSLVRSADSHNPA